MKTADLEEALTLRRSGELAGEQAHKARVLASSPAQQMLEQANDCFNNAKFYDHDLPYLKCIFDHNKIRGCDLCFFNHYEQQILDAATKGKRAGAPFIIMSDSDVMTHVRQATEKWVQGKIKLDYFISSHFHDHVTCFLAIEKFEKTDNSLIEIIALSFDLQKYGTTQVRLLQAHENFVKVSGMTDLEITQLTRLHEINIAIALKDFMQAYSIGILALPAALIQINYGRYSGTMVKNNIEFLISGGVVITKKSKPPCQDYLIIPDEFQLTNNNVKTLKINKHSELINIKIF